MSARFERIDAARRAARPMRRLLAKLVLVDEEKIERIAADEELASTRTEIAALRIEIARLEGLVAIVRSDFGPIEARTTAHTDLVVGEALRRAEAVDARLATENQRLREIVERLDHEQGAILRLLSGDKTLDPSLAEGMEPAAIVEPLDGRSLFEEIERGSREEVVVKLRDYLPLFRDRTPIVDLGCGRGEFLELASWVGLEAYGVDSDPGVVAACEAAGLHAVVGDLHEHLAGLADASLGGVFCAQVVEHLPAALLEPLFADIARVLRPGGRTVVETPNAACFSTYVQSFWRDPTHLRPVPAARLSWAARSVGLVVDEVRFCSPAPESDRLSMLELATDDPDMASVVRSHNRTAAQLNYLLYGPQDVALIASKPA